MIRVFLFLWQVLRLVSILLFVFCLFEKINFAQKFKRLSMSVYDKILSNCLKQLKQLTRLIVVDINCRQVTSKVAPKLID